MDWNHFDKDRSELKFHGIIASIYHRKFPKGTYEYVVLPDTVKILATTQEGKVLINTEKIFSSNETFYSLPGGTINDKEGPVKTAMRELLEETGYTSTNIRPWFDRSYSQTIISRTYFFIAKNCIKQKTQDLDATENIHVKEYDLENFLKIATSQNFKHIDLQGHFMKMRYDVSFCKKFEQKMF